MNQPLTFDAIWAMDDESLNLAIEHVIYGRVWTQYGEGEDANGDRLYEGRRYDGFVLYTLSTDFAHTRFWDNTMDLWYAHGTPITMGHADDGAILIRVPAGMAEANGAALRCSILRCTTEEETRHAICALTLWLVARREYRMAVEAETTSIEARK